MEAVLHILKWGPICKLSWITHTKKNSKKSKGKITKSTYYTTTGWVKVNVSNLFMFWEYFFFKKTSLEFFKNEKWVFVWVRVPV